MAIVTRAGKGSALSHGELDGNFTDLDGRATAASAAISQLDADVVKTVNGQAPDGAGNVTVSGGGGSPANLGNTPGASTVAITNSNGTGTTLPAATSSLAGVMTAAQATKLAGIDADIATAANAKVQNSLTASTSVAPSATAVNTALTGKADSANPVFSGVTLRPGATTSVGAAMAANAIDVAVEKNTKSIAADTTFTFSTTPPSGRVFSVELTATAPSVVTIPSCYSVARQAAITSFYMPIGTILLTFVQGASQCLLFGDVQARNNLTATTDPTATDDQTFGYGIGSRWINGATNKEFTYTSGGNDAAVWTDLTAAGGGGGGDVTLTGTQTLTNKTLTAPVLGGTVTGTYTLGGTPTFPSTVVSTTGAQTLSNKTLVAPALGTPASGNLSLCTNVPAGQVVGVIPVANLGTGTPTGTKFLRDDGVLAVPPTGAGSANLPFSWVEGLLNDFEYTNTNMDGIVQVTLAGGTAGEAFPTSLLVNRNGISRVNAASGQTNSGLIYRSTSRRLRVGDDFVSIMHFDPTTVIADQANTNVGGRAGFASNLTATLPTSCICLEKVGHVITGYVIHGGTTTATASTYTVASANFFAMRTTVISSTQVQFRVYTPGSATPVFDQTVTPANLASILGAVELFPQIGIWTGTLAINANVTAVGNIDFMAWGNTTRSAGREFF